MKVLQADPKASYLAHRDEIDKAINRVLNSGWYILGKEVAAFEEEFSNFLGVSYGVGVASGTDALVISLKACDVGPGDAVFTVSHTAVATVAAIELCGAVPVFIDIDEETFTLDPEHLISKIREIKKNGSLKAKAVIPVHLYGHPARMAEITEISRKNKLWVLEDCAQSHGAEIFDRPTGAWGDISAFSFYPTKNLGAFGDGGFIGTDNKELAEKTVSLRQYGWKKRYVSEEPGENSRLDELQAAILREKLKFLRNDNSRRRRIAKKYSKALSETDLLLPNELPESTHVFHQYVIRHDYRDILKARLEHAGVQTGIHYPIPVHQQPAYKSRGHLGVPLAVTEKISKEILSLPLYPQLPDSHVDFVIKNILQILKNF